MISIEDQRILELIKPIRNPARTETIRIRSIKRFVQQLKSEAILNLNPVFQRGKQWDVDRQTKYMENVLRGLVSHSTNIIRLNDPSLAFVNNNYIAKDCDLPNETMCIDGLQRFSTMISYMDGELKPFGLTLEEIEASPCGVKANNLSFSVAWHDFQYEYELIDFYRNLNWGGVPHSQEEFIRVNGLYDEALEKFQNRNNSV